MKREINPEGVRVLMVGYNGANNTGAEALLQADIEDVRAVIGPGVHITVPTLNEANLRRYLKESPTLRISPMPTLYFGAIRRMVRENDLILLVEGSTYMDTWGSPLLWAFLWATRCAAHMGKPSMAYAVDVGTLKAANRRRVRNTASQTGFIVTRTRAAAERLLTLGVTAPMASTADNALTFQPREDDIGWPMREWSEAGSGIVGLAMVDFFLWPAVMRPWGKRQRCYKWPYYFSSSPARKKASESLARGYAALADDVIERTGKVVALISMEQVDEGMAELVYGFMKHADRARRFSAREYDASRMTCLLRCLDLLITSRFHAAILSLSAGIPQIAVGHDTRLSTLYEDLGLKDQWFLNPGTAGGTAENFSASTLFPELEKRVHHLLEHPGVQAECLRQGYQEHLTRARNNRQFLRDFIGKTASLNRDTSSKGIQSVMDGNRISRSKGGRVWVA